jgi:hypothetical protein
MKKNISSCILLVVIAAILAGCGTKDEAPAQLSHETGMKITPSTVPHQTQAQRLAFLRKKSKS